jgi:hypothetical protein
MITRAALNRLSRKSAHKYPVQISGASTYDVAGGSSMAAHKAVAATEDFRPQLLEGLEQRDRKSILGAAKNLHFSAHSVVYAQGNPARHLFLLKEGDARYFCLTPEGRLKAEGFSALVFCRQKSSASQHSRSNPRLCILRASKH